jgi:hypothetical protein
VGLDLLLDEGAHGLPEHRVLLGENAHARPSGRLKKAHLLRCTPGVT